MAVKEDRTPNAADRSRAAQFKITPEEFIRRDNIVRQMFLDCDFQINQRVTPVTDKSYDMYGYCVIRTIRRTYHDFTTKEGMEWPADDRPLTVAAEPTKKPDGINLILCTPGFLRRVS